MSVREEQKIKKIEVTIETLKTKIDQAFTFFIKRKEQKIKKIEVKIETLKTKIDQAFTFFIKREKHDNQERKQR